MRFFFLLIFCSIYSLPVYAQITISEFSGNPSQSEGINDAFVELYTPTSYNLGCHVLTNGEWAVFFPPNTNVLGYYLIACSDGGDVLPSADCDLSTAGANGLTCDICDFQDLPIGFDICDPANAQYYDAANGGFNLDNSEQNPHDQIVLFDENGQIIQAFQYGYGNTDLPSTDNQELLNGNTYQLGDAAFGSSNYVPSLPTFSGCDFTANSFVMPAITDAVYTNVNDDYESGCNSSYIIDATGNSSLSNSPTPGVDNSSALYSWTFNGLDIAENAMIVCSTGVTQTDEFTITLQVNNWQAVNPNVYNEDGDVGSYVLDPISSQTADGTSGGNNFYNWNFDNFNAGTGITTLTYTIIGQDIIYAGVGTYNFAVQWTEYTTCNGASSLEVGSRLDCSYFENVQLVIVDELTALDDGIINCSGDTGAGLINVSDFISGGYNLNFSLYDINDVATPLQTNNSGTFQIPVNGLINNGYIVEIIDGSGCENNIEVEILENCEADSEGCPTSITGGQTNQTYCEGEQGSLQFNIELDDIPAGGIIALFADTANVISNNGFNFTNYTNLIINSLTTAQTFVPGTDTVFISEIIIDAQNINDCSENLTEGNGNPEWIELAGTPGMDLSCFSISDGELVITFPPSTIIPSDGILAIGPGKCYNDFVFDIDISDYNGDGNADCSCTSLVDSGNSAFIDLYAIGLNNDVEIVVLFDANGNAINGVSWGNEGNGNTNLENGNFEGDGLFGCESVLDTINLVTNTDLLVDIANAIDANVTYFINNSGTWVSSGQFQEPALGLSTYQENYDLGTPGYFEAILENNYFLNASLAGYECGTTITLYVNVLGCSEYDSISVIIECPTESSFEDVSFCSGTSAELNPTGWIADNIAETEFVVIEYTIDGISVADFNGNFEDFTDNQSGIVEITDITSPFGGFTIPSCHQFTPFEVTEIQSPDPNTTPTLTTCQDSIIFELANFNGVFSYTYELNGVEFQGTSSNNFLTLPIISGIVPVLTSVSNDICLETVNITATANPPTAPTIPAFAACNDGVETYTFTDFETHANQTGTFEWFSVNPETVQNPTPINTTGLILTFTVPTTYYFNYTDGSGCVSVGSFEVNATTTNCGGCTDITVSIDDNLNEQCFPLSGNFDFDSNNSSFYTFDAGGYSTEEFYILFDNEQVNDLSNVNYQVVDGLYNLENIQDGEQRCIGFLAYDVDAFNASSLNNITTETAYADLLTLEADLIANNICFAWDTICYSFNNSVILTNTDFLGTTELSNTFNRVFGPDTAFYCQATGSSLSLPILVNGVNGSWYSLPDADTTNNGTTIIDLGAVGATTYYFYGNDETACESGAFTFNIVPSFTLVDTDTTVCQSASIFLAFENIIGAQFEPALDQAEATLLFDNLTITPVGSPSSGIFDLINNQFNPIEAGTFEMTLQVDQSNIPFCVDPLNSTFEITVTSSGSLTQYAETICATEYPVTFNLSDLESNYLSDGTIIWLNETQTNAISGDYNINSSADNHSFVWSVTNFGTCSDTAQFFLNVAEVPEPSSNELLACSYNLAGDSALFNITNFEMILNDDGFTIVDDWLDENGDAITDPIQYLSSNTTITTNINHTLTDCEITYSLALNVYEKLEIVDYATSICNSNTFSLESLEEFIENGNTFVDFNWSVTETNEQQLTQTEIENFSITETTIVYAFGVDADECESTLSVVTLNFDAITVEAESVTVERCEGENPEEIILSVTDEGYDYFWYGSVDTITALNETSSTTFGVNIVSSEDYFVVAVDNILGCRSEATLVDVTITINPAPNLTLDNDEVCADNVGGNYQFDLQTINATAGAITNWYNATDTTLVDATVPVAIGDYLAANDDGGGCITYTTLEVQNCQCATITELVLTGATIDNGVWGICDFQQQNFELTINNPDGQEIDAHWFFNEDPSPVIDADISDNETRGFQIPEVNCPDTIALRVELYCTTQTEFVDVIDLDIIVFPSSLNFTFLPNTESCGYSIQEDICEEFYTITWEDDLGNAGNGSNYIPDFTNDPTSLTFTVTNNYFTDFNLGCADAETTEVSNNIFIPSITGNNNETICSGETITLSIDNNFDNYEWYSDVDTSAASSLTLGNTLTETFVDTTTLYIVATSNQNPSCKILDSITVFVEPLIIDNVDLTACSGTTTNYNGVEYNAGETVELTVPAATGCDTLRTIIVEEITPRDSIINETICAGGSYTAFTETVYTETGSEQFTDANECIATLSVNIIVSEALDSTETATICEGGIYTALLTGTEYTEAGTNSEVYTGVDGCITNLTINLSFFNATEAIQDTARFCIGDEVVYISPITGNDYTESTTETLQDANGCDYEYQLVIEVIECVDPCDAVDDITEIASICDGESYTATFDGLEYTESTVIPQIDENGCDFDLIINLTELTPQDSTEVATICEGDTYTALLTGTEYTVTDSEPIIDVSGCAATFFVNLSFYPTTQDSLETVELCLDIDDSYTSLLTGNTYTESATEDLTDTNGCSYQYILTINEIDCTDPCDVVQDVPENGNICSGGSYVSTFDGLEYTTSTIVPQTDENGCDFDLIINLTELTPQDSTEVATICEGDTYTALLTGTEYLTSGSEQIIDVNGCEATLSVELTFEPCTDACPSLVSLDFAEGFEESVCFASATFFDVTLTPGSEASNAIWIYPDGNTSMVNIPANEAFIALSQTLAFDDNIYQTDCPTTFDIGITVDCNLNDTLFEEITVYPLLSQIEEDFDTLDNCNIILNNPCPEFYDIYLRQADGSLTLTNEAEVKPLGTTDSFYLAYKITPSSCGLDTSRLITYTFPDCGCQTASGWSINGGVANVTQDTVFACSGQNLDFTLLGLTGSPTISWLINGGNLEQQDTYNFSALVEDCTPQFFELSYSIECATNPATESIIVAVYPDPETNVGISQLSCGISLIDYCPQLNIFYDVINDDNGIEWINSDTYTMLESGTDTVQFLIVNPTLSNYNVSCDSVMTNDVLVICNTDCTDVNFLGASTVETTETNICSSDSVQISLSNYNTIYNYSWSSSLGNAGLAQLDTSDYANPVFNPTQIGSVSFTLTVNDGNNCQEFSLIEISIEQPLVNAPDVATPVGSTIACGDSILFNIESGNGGNYFYWYDELPVDGVLPIYETTDTFFYYHATVEGGLSFYVASSLLDESCFSPASPEFTFNVSSCSNCDDSNLSVNTINNETVFNVCKNADEINGNILEFSPVINLYEYVEVVGDAVDYEWLVPEVDILGCLEGGNTFEAVAILNGCADLSSFDVTFIATDASGCSDSTFFDVVINPALYASIDTESLNALCPIDGDVVLVEVNQYLSFSLGDSESYADFIVVQNADNVSDIDTVYFESGNFNTDILIDSVGTYNLINITNHYGCITEFDDVSFSIVEGYSPDFVLIGDTVYCNATGDSINFEIQVFDGNDAVQDTLSLNGNTVLYGLGITTDTLVPDGGIIAFNILTEDYPANNLTITNINNGCPYDYGTTNVITINNSSDCFDCFADAGIVESNSGTLEFCKGGDGASFTTNSGVANDENYGFTYILTNNDDVVDVNELGIFDLIDINNQELSFGTYNIYGVSYYLYGDLYDADETSIQIQIGQGISDIQVFNLDAPGNIIGQLSDGTACIDTSSVQFEILDPDAGYPAVFPGSPTGFAQYCSTADTLNLFDLINGTNNHSGEWEAVTSIPTGAIVQDSLVIPSLLESGISNQLNQFEFNYIITVGSCADTNEVSFGIWDELNADLSLSGDEAIILCLDPSLGVGEINLDSLLTEDADTFGSWTFAGEVLDTINGILIPEAVGNSIVNYFVEASDDNYCLDASSFFNVSVSTCTGCPEIFDIVLDNELCNDGTTTFDVSVNTDSIGNGLVFNLVFSYDGINDALAYSDFFTDSLSYNSIAVDSTAVFSDISLPTVTGNVDTIFIYAIYANPPSAECIPVASDTLIVYNSGFVFDELPDTIPYCNTGDLLPINLSAGTVSYAWEDSTLIDPINPLVANLIASSPDTPYIITASNGVGACDVIDTIYITPSEIALDIPYESIGHCTGEIPTPLDNILTHNTDVNPIVSYSWLPVVGVSNPGIALPLFNPTETTTYELTITNSDGCTASDSFIVFVPDDFEGFFINGVATSTVDVCNGDVVQFTIPEVENLSWINGDFALDTTQPDFTTLPIETGSVKFVYSADFNGCPVSDTLDVILVDEINVEISTPSTLVCNGAPAELTAIGNVSNYYWVNYYNNDTLSTEVDFSYSLTQTNDTIVLIGSTVSGSCFAADTIFLQEVSGPPTSQNILLACSTDTILIANENYTVKSVEPVGYGIVDDGGFIFNNDNQFEGETNLSFTIEWYGVETCDSITNINIIILSGEPEPWTFDNLVTACQGDDVLLNPSLPDGITLEWEGGLGTFDDTLSVITNYYPDPFETNVELTAIVDDGCDNLQYYDVNINFTSNDTIYAEAETYTINGGQSVELSVIDGGTGNYLWLPSSTLNVDTGEVVIASPSETTNYVVVDSSQCSYADTIRIEVLQAQLIIPTAFSPNGDGVNDFFEIQGQSLERFNFKVYNRWGLKLAELNGVEESWDGTHNGEPQDMGVYMYVIEYKFEGTQTRIESGNITLVR